MKTLPAPLLTGLLLTGLLLPPASPLLAGDETDPPGESSKPKNSAPAEPQENTGAERRAAAEQAFSAALTGATLVGNFTIDAEKPVDPTQLLKPDRYELATVNKVKDDIWLFVYVHKGVPIPLTMKVLWAGTTPVLTLDEFTIAGMGTFSGRVMFHGNRYAGTWQHGSKGGLMFGKIETAAAKKQAAGVDSRQVPPPHQREPKEPPEPKE